MRNGVSCVNLWLSSYPSPAHIHPSKPVGKKWLKLVHATSCWIPRGLPMFHSHIHYIILFFRYRTRRDRSKSLSRSPVRGRQKDRSQSRSPRRSQSPLDRQKPALSSRLQSRLGPQRHILRSARGRSRSKSPGRLKFRSDADHMDTADKGRSQSSSRSSSPTAANGLVAYGDGSPDK